MATEQVAVNGRVVSLADWRRKRIAEANQRALDQARQGAPEQRQQCDPTFGWMLDVDDPQGPSAA